jgi:predicted nucleotidyltransferase
MNDYEKILRDARENENILGLVLLGSRGKGFHNEHSDYDMVMVAKDEMTTDIHDSYEVQDLDNVDLAIYSLSDFKKYAGWESAETWDRYDYAHTEILVDKTGELPEVIKAKGYIPEDKKKEFVEHWIDGYVNGVFRSVKCIRNNNQFGAHLEAINSMLDFFTLVFGLNGRHRPFLGYIEKELEKYPLELSPLPKQELIEKVEEILSTADLKTQQELLVAIEKLCREHGYGHVFDGWEGKDKWTITYKK